MRHHILLVLLVTMAYVPAIGPAFGRATKKSPAEGEWKGQWHQGPVTLKLAVKGKALSGTLTYEFALREDLQTPEKKTGVDTTEIEDGKISGNKIEFKCDLRSPDGTPFTVTFTGVIKQDMLTLTPQKPASGGPVTLKRSTT